MRYTRKHRICNHSVKYSQYSISSFFYNPHGDELCNPTILQPSGSLNRFEQRPQGHLIFSAPYDIYIIYIYVCLENRSHNMPQASVQRSNRNNHCSNCLVPSGADENMATSMLTSSVFSQIWFCIERNTKMNVLFLSKQ